MPHIEHEKDWPSVTTIVGVLNKPQLYRWFGKLGWDECERIKRESADIGTRVHSVFESCVRKEPLPNDTDQILRLGLNAHKELERKPFKVWAIEEEMESEKYEFHGCADLIGEYDGIPTVIDLKTSNQIYREVVLQLTGYKMLWDETHEVPLKNGLIVNVHKTTEKTKNVVFTDLEQYIPVFLGLLEAWKFSNKRPPYDESSKVARHS